jgi:arylformamidase
MFNDSLQKGFRSEESSILDLTQTLEEGIPLAGMLPPFHLKGLSRTSAGQSLNVGGLELSEHTGTHMDVPFHVYHDGNTVEMAPPDVLVGPISVYDFSNIPVEKGICKQDLLDDEKRTGISAKEGDVVLLHTGHYKYWSPTPEGQAYLKNRPFLTTDLADELVSRRVKAVGMDMGGPDPLGGVGHPVHKILLGAGIYIIESLREIIKVPPKGYVFLGFPLLIKGGSGSPIRALAVSQSYLLKLVDRARSN